MKIIQLEVELEQELIAKAKAGNNEATKTLLEQYGPALKAAKYKAGGSLDHSEAESAVNAAFAEALFRFDPAKHSRLATLIKNLLAQETSYESSTKLAVSIPERTLSRYWNIMRKANMNASKAVKIAPDNGMSTVIFSSIHQANLSESLEHIPYTEEIALESIQPETRVPTTFQRESVKSIFRELEDDNDLTSEEIQVLSVHYGLAGVDTDKSFDFTAEELQIPRGEVIKLHRSAITKARKRLS